MSEAEDHRDFERILGATARARREPTDYQIAEVMNIKLIRDALDRGQLTVAVLRKQFGGINREMTIRKAARVFAFYHCQIQIIEDDNGIALTVPDGMREMFLALKEARRADN